VTCSGFSLSSPWWLLPSLTHHTKYQSLVGPSSPRPQSLILPHPLQIRSVSIAPASATRGLHRNLPFQSPITLPILRRAGCSITHEANSRLALAFRRGCDGGCCRRLHTLRSGHSAPVGAAHSDFELPANGPELSRCRYLHPCSAREFHFLLHRQPPRQGLYWISKYLGRLSSVHHRGGMFGPPMRSCRDLIWLVVAVALMSMTLPPAPRYDPAPGQSNLCRPPTELTFTPQAFSFDCRGRNHAKPYKGFPRSSGFIKCSFDHGLLDHP